MITNCYNSTETIEKKNKEIPKVIDEYNKYMGGVDKFDQMIKYYPLKRKTNRWTQKFTVHVLELLLHNAYVLYKKYSTEKLVSHYDFIESIITYLIKNSNTTVLFNKKGEKKKLHLPLKTSKRHYCKNCYLVDRTRSTTSIMCEKCNAHLCISPCFYTYHSNEPENSSDSEISY